MGIHKALRIIIRDPERIYNWVKKPSRPFETKSALDIMLGAELTDIMRVGEGSV